MIVGIIIGLIIGAPLGMVIAGLMTMASKYDELEEKEIREASMENRCVCCGAVIPEGRQVCWICEKKTYSK